VGTLEIPVFGKQGKEKLSYTTASTDFLGKTDPSASYLRKAGKESSPFSLKKGKKNGRERDRNKKHA